MIDLFKIEIASIISFYRLFPFISRISIYYFNRWCSMFCWKQLLDLHSLSSQNSMRLVLLRLVFKSRYLNSRHSLKLLISKHTSHFKLLPSLSIMPLKQLKVKLLRSLPASSVRICPLPKRKRKYYWESMTTNWLVVFLRLQVYRLLPVKSLWN